MTEQKTEFANEIRADRACVGCGFNLYAQPVTKEEHYGLAIARCPECGTVAALQNYPAMSHWVSRFQSLIAVVWVVILLGAFAGNTTILVGMASGASNLAGDKMAEKIGMAHFYWNEEQTQLNAQTQQAAQGNVAATVPGLPAGTTIVTTNGVTTINGVVIASTPKAKISPGQAKWSWLTSGWADDHLDQVIEEAGGLWKNIDPVFLAMFIPGTILSVLFGIFWSVALLAGSKRRVAIIPVITTLLAVFILIGISVPKPNFTYASNMSQDLYAPIIGPIYLFVLFLFALFGVWIGRWITRWVIVLALPPRSRVPFSILWTRDGLALPKSK